MRFLLESEIAAAEPSIAYRAMELMRVRQAAVCLSQPGNNPADEEAVRQDMFVPNGCQE